MPLAQLGNLPKSSNKLARFPTSGGKPPFECGKFPLSTPAAVAMTPLESNSEQKTSEVELGLASGISLGGRRAVWRPGVPWESWMKAFVDFVSGESRITRAWDLGFVKRAAWREGWLCCCWC
jgi:hypothetical protein